MISYCRGISRCSERDPGTTMTAITENRDRKEQREAREGVHRIMKKEKKPKEPRLETAMRIVGIILWVVFVVVLFIHRDRISVDAILERTPENRWGAVLLMLFLFTVKGMSMVLHAGILYTASGLLFPLPLAFLVNLLGTCCMVTAPWLYGRFVGENIAERFDAKYPAAARVASFREKNDWLFSLGVRLLTGLPSDPLSMYLGAVKLSWPALIFGAVLAYLPNAVTLPILARNAGSPGSPVFVISAAAAVLFACVPAIFLLILFIRKRRAKRKTEDNREDKETGSL